VDISLVVWLAVEVLKYEPINLLGALNWSGSEGGRGIVIYLGMGEAKFVFVLRRLRMRCRICDCQQEDGRARPGGFTGAVTARVQLSIISFLIYDTSTSTHVAGLMMRFPIGESRCKEEISVIR